MGKLVVANEVLTAYINQRVLELDGQKREILKQIANIQIEKKTDVEQVSSYMEKWESLTLDDKRAVVDMLIQVVHATEKHVEIKWKL